MAGVSLWLRLLRGAGDYAGGSVTGFPAAVGCVIAAMLASSVNVSSASAAVSGCAWANQVGAGGIPGYASDLNATYWVTSFLALPGTGLTIDGAFPNARYMSISAYNTLGSSSGVHFYDAQIQPRPGPINSSPASPWAPPGPTSADRGGGAAGPAGAEHAAAAGNTVRLRAERDRHGHGRLYFIAVKLTDRRRVSCRRTLTVAVPRTRGQRRVRDTGRRYRSFATPGIGGRRQR